MGQPLFRSIRATFGHGGRNWGATAINEIVNVNETSEVELQLKTLDQLVGHRRVSLLKIDCEGCEWAALKSGRRTLKKTPMIKIELVQPHWEDGKKQKFVYSTPFSFCPIALHWEKLVVEAQLVCLHEHVTGIDKIGGWIFFE